MGNIREGRLAPEELKYLDLPTKELERLLLRKGDILVNRTNSAELVGKCAVFDLEGPFAFASYLIRLRLDPERADAKFFSRFINSATHPHAWPSSQNSEATRTPVPSPDPRSAAPSTGELRPPHR
jgi:hypothetical protein